MANDEAQSGSDLISSRSGFSLCLLLSLLTAGSLSAQQGTTVSARLAAVKGVVMAAAPGSSEKQVQKGESIRSGTVISCGAQAGASLKPLPTLHVIVYPDTKGWFDGADLHANGGGNVRCSVLSGKALFHIDQGQQGGASSKVSVVTEEGVIVNTMGGGAASGGGKQPVDPASRQIDAATWTVQHDEGRTVVAVGEGVSHVSIGKGAAAASGEVGGQVQVPQGSVIWLYNRGGKIEADLVNTQTGKVTNLTGGSSSGGGNLVAQSKQQIIAPSSSSTANTLGTPTGTTTSTLPTNTSSNPDLSTPQKPLPVVSADTP